MPVNQFDTSYADYGPAEFILTLRIFADLLLGHHFFKDNWPSYITHPTVLKEQLNLYAKANEAAVTDGGRKNLKERDERRQEAYKSSVFMAQYVVMRAESENDPSFLTSVGLPLKKKRRQERPSNKAQPWPLRLV
jgi:hypothetical protein